MKTNGKLEEVESIIYSAHGSIMFAYDDEDVQKAIKHYESMGHKAYVFRKVENESKD